MPIMATLVKITDIEQMKTDFAQLESKEPEAVSIKIAVEHLSREIISAHERGYSLEELYDKFLASSKKKIGFATFRSYLNKANGKKKKRKPTSESVAIPKAKDVVKSKDGESPIEKIAVVASSKSPDTAEQETDKGQPEVTHANLSTLSNASHPEMSKPTTPADQSDALEASSDQNGICSESYSQSNENVGSNCLDNLLDGRNDFGTDNIHIGKVGMTNGVGEPDLKQISAKLSLLGDDKNNGPNTGQTMSAEEMP
jgi:hypothetical protein